MSKTSQKEARKQAIQLLSKDIVFLDTETTGLGDDDEIVEISIIDKHGRILLNNLLKPLKPIPYEVSKISKITNELVEDALLWPEIYQEYRRVVKDKVVVIYNKKFDNRLLKQTCKKYQLPTPRIKSVCLMELYALYEGVINRKTGQYKWFKLTDAIEKNDILACGGFHESLGDASASRELLYFIAGEDSYSEYDEAGDKLLSNSRESYNGQEFFHDNDKKMDQVVLENREYSSFDEYYLATKNKIDNDDGGDPVNNFKIIGFFCFIAFMIILILSSMGEA